jgi:stage II sporulation SpoE-like protein/GAF domain-containing protein
VLKESGEEPTDALGARDGAHPPAAWLGGTLDVNEAAQQVLGIAVPWLADAGAVYLLEPVLTADAVVASPPGGRVVTRCLATSVPAEAAPAWRGLASGGDVVIFGAASPQARCLSGRERVQFGEDWAEPGTTFLALPLAGREGVTGLLLLARKRSRLGYRPPDLATAGELAAQAGVCVDNARLFAREQRIAQALQRGLLPGDPPALAGLQIAHSYRPAGDHLVGGDWYGLVPLPGDRTAIMVGDAMGHGPEAATVMIQLRAAAHALALLDMPPHELLGHLNRMAASLTHGTFATCVCATLDPVAGTGSVARAGHLPPVLWLPDGSCEEIDLPPGLPLGLGDAAYSSARIPLPPGATLVLYTDGLVESRTQEFDEGILALRAELAASATRPLRETCDAIMDVLFQGGDDDTTLVLARIP